MDLLWDGLTQAFILLFQRDPLVFSAAARSLWVTTCATFVAGVAGVIVGSVLARARFAGRRSLVVLFRTGMSLPTVLVGLVCYALLSRRGPLGGLELLYHSWGIVLGEFVLALPIVVSWTHRGIRDLDPRVAETARTLGAGLIRRWLTDLSESRRSLMLAWLTAFSRCFTELGIAMMVGGNIKYRTRTLATATALETARGEFARGVAMSLILLSMALLVALLMAWLTRDEEDT